MFWLLAAVLLGSCAQPEAVHRGPVLWITSSALRPDVVGSLGGEPGWTPRLDEFAASAAWQGRAVAASSSPMTALATLVTGVDPWQHQLLSHLDTRVTQELPTVADRLEDAGFRSTVFFPLLKKFRDKGLFKGFGEVVDLSQGSATEKLAQLDGGAELVWVHLDKTSAPYNGRKADVPHLAQRPDPRDSRVTREQLIPYGDPSKPLPRPLRDLAWELYRHEAAAADQEIGRLLDALEASGQWDTSWIIVMSNMGAEFGEHGQVLFGQNLGRESIEVPLFIKSPKTTSRKLAAPSYQPVAAGRLAATFIDIAGGSPPPSLLPSLFVPSTLPILSSLYMRNGRNHFSLLLPDTREQLFWRPRFADPEPDFFLAQQDKKSRPRQLSESAKTIFKRLELQFLRSLPLAGDGWENAEIHLERWLEPGGVEVVDDAPRSRDLLVQLRHRWSRFAGREQTPMQQRRPRRPRVDGAAKNATADSAEERGSGGNRADRAAERGVADI